MIRGVVRGICLLLVLLLPWAGGTALAVACDVHPVQNTKVLARLRELGILIDGEGVVAGGETKILLQLFSANAIGPIFFEFIQRKGDDGFGEGNFKALFELIEEDQIRRGVFKVDAAA